MASKRKVKQRYACQGVMLDDNGMVKLCREDATVIAQVNLYCGMKDLCDECLQRYRHARIVTRVLVELVTRGKRK